MKMKQNFVEFKVDVNDVITPSSCSAMIVEFIKYIAYQKQLIPYPYERLKMYVSQRKKQLSSETEVIDPATVIENSKQSLISRKYFKKTEAAHNSLENMFKVITDELTSVNYDRVKEVVLLLGTSFTNPQDVYRLCIPTLNYSHSVKYHSAQKNWRNLFRSMINSEKFNDIVSGSSCTGTLHILLKMKSTANATNMNLYIPRVGFKVPSKGNHAIITFQVENNVDCPCGAFKIFQDDSERMNANSKCEYSNDGLPTNTSNNITTDYEQWYQIKDTLKYFADVTVNNVSLTNIWMNPKIAIE